MLVSEPRENIKGLTVLLSTLNSNLCFSWSQQCASFITVKCDQNIPDLPFLFVTWWSHATHFIFTLHLPWILCACKHINYTGNWMHAYRDHCPVEAVEDITLNCSWKRGDIPLFSVLKFRFCGELYNWKSKMALKWGKQYANCRTLKFCQLPKGTRENYNPHGKRQTCSQSSSRNVVCTAVFIWTLDVADFTTLAHSE